MEGYSAVTPIVLCFDDIVLCLDNCVLWLDNIVLCLNNTMLCFDNSLVVFADMGQPKVERKRKNNFSVNKITVITESVRKNLEIIE